MRVSFVLLFTSTISTSRVRILGVVTLASWSTRNILNLNGVLMQLYQCVSGSAHVSNPHPAAANADDGCRNGAVHQTP